MRLPSHVRRLAIVITFVPSLVWSQPAEVDGVTLDPSSTLSWTATTGADDYNVYRGFTTELNTAPPSCLGDEIVATSFSVADDPVAGRGFSYLVTAESDADGEGTLGTGSAGMSRSTSGPCDSMVKHHVLSRMGYGWSDWNSDRYDLLGPQGYVDEQLAPLTISESTDLTSRLALWDPPTEIIHPINDRFDRTIYSRRQFQEVMIQFWTNHFNTDYNKTLNYIFDRDFFDSISAARVLTRENHLFRDEAFTADFRQILETSALSPSMIIFLDTSSNVVGAPNENYARELLELYALGVQGGYTEEDVRELSRIFTGWTTCKKTPGNEDDPLAACRDSFTAIGLNWVPHFQPNLHDSGQKILFAGTPQQVVIPDTSSNPSEGVNDVALALDAIAAHPATSDFISRKLIQMLLTDEPTDALVQAVVSEWNATSGDLASVTREVIEQGMLDPRYVRQKVRDPLEHVASLYRGVESNLNADQTEIAWNLVYALGYRLQLYDVPTGHPETGRDWVGTNGVLDRQNRALNAVSDPTAYGTDVTGVVSRYGLTTAPEIVDFFVETLLGNAISPAERNALETYLTTDATGTPAPYDDDRIRSLVGLILGMAQFMEQ